MSNVVDIRTGKPVAAVLTPVQRSEVVAQHAPAFLDALTRFRRLDSQRRWYARHDKPDSTPAA